MAGKLQLAAKYLLGTSLLTSGTGGVYYATTNGWTSPSVSPPVAEQADTELEAVASAWGDPAAKHATTSADSSPVARSAKAPAAAKEPTKPAEADRYAATTPVPEAVKVVEVEPAQAENSKERKATTKDKSQEAALSVAEQAVAKATEAPAVDLVAEAKDKPTKKSDAAREPTPVLPAQDEPIARGQEPANDASAKDVSADISSAFDSAPPSGAAASIAPAAKQEPKPLAAPSQQAGGSGTTSPAKDGFGSAPNTTAAAAGDRYSGGTRAGSPNNAMAKPAASNPFGATPLAAPPSGGSGDRLAPLPAHASDNGSPLREMQPTNDGLRPLEAASASSSSTAPQRSATRDSGINATNGMKNRMPQASPYNNAPTGMDSYSPSNGANAAALGSGPSGAMQGDGTGKPGEKALEGPQQPTLVIQKFAPGEIQVGKPAKFVMQVRNSGNQVAENVIVHDEVPQGTQLVSTSPTATNEGSRLVWQLGKLSPGEDRTIEMQVMPKTEGDIGSVATVTYSSQASVKTRCTMPQLAIRMTAPSEVMIGKQQHVKIEIRNPGSGDATGVMLFENVPPNVKHAAGPTLEFEIGTLRAGETRELDLVLTAEKPGKVTNVLTARAQGSLQVQQQVEFEVIAPALTIAVQGPERRYLERPATYEVSVQNPGTASAHDVQIVTKLPKGLRFVKANNMGEYDANSHAVYWSLAELPKGEKGTVELTAIPVEAGPQTLEVESHAQQGLADKTQREVIVEGLAAIKFDVKVLNDPIEIGGETGYEIRVTNQGTKAATNVQVMADLPPGLKLTSAEGETAHRMDQNRVVFEPMQTLATKADTVYRLRVQGVQVGDQRVGVEVKADDLQQPIRHEESTRVFGDQ